jgi:5-methylcytosine-specific restriction protein A
MGKATTNWSERDIEISVQAYLLMLRAQQSGVTPNKSAVRAIYLSQLNGSRSAGSWERRMCNISAVLDSHDLPYVKGYKPLTNVGKNVHSLIVRAIVRYLV